jgi:Flp pilus assembly protein TadG
MKRRTQGSVAVEFALVGTVLISLLLGITAFGHWMYTLEMVADATRSGARIAVVCDLSDTAIRSAVQNRVPQLSLTNAQITLQYLPNGCTKSNCQSVRIGLSGATYSPWFPAAAAFPIPPFTTSLPRESLESVNAAGETNPSCN